ncbi:MAG: DUF2191 domain-containing protein [Gammaproteobacteria bacterium]|nr:DUF2191 domain-containing protein [Gammaproteobacteria bacterium]
MKTTIELADDLAQRARQLARKRGITFKAVIEDAIRLSLAEEERRGQYTLPDKRVAGSGLQEEFRDKSWSEIREAAYEGKYN